MKINDVSVTEPRMPLSFASADRCVEHVDKHVYKKWQEERWRNVLSLSTETVASARADWQTGKTNSKAMQEVADCYEQYLAEFITGVCEQGKDHVHLVRYALPADLDELEVDGKLALDARFQYVMGWKVVLRVVCIAAQPVRNTKRLPYHLKCGYRIDARLNINRVRAKINGQKRKMLQFKMFQLLADHENEHGTVITSSR